MSRRHFLSVALASPLIIRDSGRALPRIEFGKDHTPIEKDIVLIGTGLSAATIAYRLLEKEITNFCVLEARNRLGGRVHDKILSNGHALELGGTWITPGQRYILRLAHELEISTFKSNQKGRRVFRHKRQVMSEALMPEDFRHPPGLPQLIKKINNLSSRILVKEPWKSQQSKKMDQYSFGSWLSHQSESSHARTHLREKIILHMGVNPDNISLLYFLYLVRSSGGLDNVFVLNEGRRFVGGPQRFCEVLLSGAQKKVTLSTPVSKIRNLSEHEILVESERMNVRAREVVLAMNPADLHRIEFEPGLPDARQQLITGWKGGSWHKMNIIYENPFWRKRGFSGESYSDEGPIIATFDNSPPGGIPGILLAYMRVGFVSGILGGTADEDIKRFIKRLFGKNVPEPIAFIDENWTKDPWSTSCRPALPEGVLSQYGDVLREPLGGLHFAGSETSAFWPGTMEGAVRSGERTAHTLIKRIAPEKIQDDED